jgi:nucleoid-associated protein YejK
VVAPRDPKQLLKLSELELPLDGGVKEILAAHVDGGVHDVQAKAARFVERDADRPCAAFGRLLAGGTDLVLLSQELARRLYKIAEKDLRVKDGTVTVLLCQAVTGDQSTVTFPAVLKLDPSATLTTVADIDEATGKQRVRYAVNTASLPSKNEKIQKCAFVQLIDDTAEYELLVVDRQRKGETVSDFWVKDFLGGEQCLDGPERTRRLYRSLREGRNAVQHEMTAHELSALDQVIDGAVVQSTVNVDSLMDALPVSAPIRDRINTVVSAALPDRQFDLDPLVASKFVHRRVFRADNGLRISIDADKESMIHVEDVDEDGQDLPLRQVWFETRTWQSL